MRLALCLAIASLPAAAQPYTLLTAGTHRVSEVPTVGRGWLGLYPDRLEPVSVTATQVRHPVDDEGKPETVTSGMEITVSGEEKPLALVKGLRSRALSPLPLAGLPGLADAVTLPLGDATLASVPKGEGRGLVLTRGKVKQVLYEQASGDSEGWLLLWAGDLDGDGKLDLLLMADHHYNLSTTRLFLSSKAGKGQLVREVAAFRSTGC